MAVYSSKFVYSIRSFENTNKNFGSENRWTPYAKARSLIFQAGCVVDSTLDCHRLTKLFKLGANHLCSSFNGRIGGEEGRHMSWVRTICTTKTLSSLHVVLFFWPPLTADPILLKC
jgi:hypothetical protein